MIYLNSYRSGRLLLAILLCALLATACAVPEKPALLPVGSISYPRFEDDLLYDGLAESIKLSLEYLQRVPSERNFQFGEDSYTATHLMRSLEQFLIFIQNQPSSKALRKFIRSEFIVYQSTGKGRTKDVLFTGYFEPLLTGRSRQDEVFNIPVLGRPDDLIKINLSLFSDNFSGKSISGRFDGSTIVPYWDRQAIEQQGVLADRAQALAWLADPIDLFFLQIQGSGSIALENGDVLNIHYDSTNGHPYRSIGKLLIDEDKIPKSEMSMQSIRAYLEANPEEQQEIFNHNPSYVFFRIEKEGPLGFLDVRLTSGRSIALDRKIFPLPALGFIETEKPLINAAGEIVTWEPFSRFVVSQDTGGAIRGPARADLFWGSGQYAEVAAGHMQNMGKLYLLVLKPDSQFAQLP